MFLTQRSSLLHTFNYHLQSCFVEKTGVGDLFEAVLFSGKNGARLRFGLPVAYYRSSNRPVVPILHGAHHKSADHGQRKYLGYRRRSHHSTNWYQSTSTASASKPFSLCVCAQLSLYFVLFRIPVVKTPRAL